jgi:hypothetical protein
MFVRVGRLEMLVTMRSMESCFTFQTMIYIFPKDIDNKREFSSHCDDGKRSPQCDIEKWSSHCDVGKCSSQCDIGKCSS